jgi:hypothetical protein
MTELKLYALLAVLGLLGGGGLLAFFRRDQQGLGAAKEKRKQQERDGRKKDETIEKIAGQRDSGVHSVDDADRVWDNPDTRP